MRAAVIGIDVSAAELEIARNENPWAQTWQPENAPPDLSADIAYSNGTFHHIPPAERPGVLAKLFHQLKPGGLFALWENNPWNPGTRMVMKRIPFDRDAITLNALETRRLLRAAGFELLRTDFMFIFPRQLAPLRLWNRLCRVFHWGLSIRCFAAFPSVKQVPGHRSGRTDSNMDG